DPAAAAVGFTLQGLTAVLQNAGLTGVAVSVDGTALKLVLTDAVSTSKQVPLNLNLQLLNSSALGNLINTQASASGQLAASATATLGIALGIDVSNPSAPRPFLYDSSNPGGGTALTLTASASASNLNFTSAVGPLSVGVAGGTFALDSDGAGS